MRISVVPDEALAGEGRKAPALIGENQD